MRPVTADAHTTHHAGDDAAGADDRREIVRRAVAARRPVDAREREAVATFLDEFDSLDRPFDERAHRTHVTASAIVIGRRGVLLHKHKRLGLWLQPGGHIDAGETPWDAARRETVEETGLSVDPAATADETRGLRDLAGGDGAGPAAGAGPALIHVDVHSGGRGHRHLDLRYLFEAPDAAPSPPAGESQQVQWFQWHRAVAIADPGLTGILRALQPGIPKLRPVRISDAGGCAEVYLRSRAFALADVPVVHEPSEVRRWMADDVIGHSDVTVAELDGTIVGLMVLDGPAGGSGWIEQLYLDPAWIGRGLGDLFVEVATQRLPTGLQLWTFQTNESAQRFYERHGFVVVERTDGSGNEERSPDVRYERPG